MNYVTEVEYTLASVPLTLLEAIDHDLLYISLEEIARHLKTQVAKVRSHLTEPVIKKLTYNGTKEVVEAILIDQYTPLLVRLCNEGNRVAVALCTHPSRQQDGQVSLLWLRS